MKILLITFFFISTSSFATNFESYDTGTFSTEDTSTKIEHTKDNDGTSANSDKEYSLIYDDSDSSYLNGTFNN